MLKINVTDFGNSDRDVIFIELSQTKDKKTEESDWESMIEKYAKSDKKILFVIKDIDDDGIVSVLIRFWLQFRDEIQIKTSKPWMNEVIRLVHGTKVTFIENIDC